jgi:hypothetical protein
VRERETGLALSDGEEAGESVKVGESVTLIVAAAVIVGEGEATAVNVGDMDMEGKRLFVTL